MMSQRASDKFPILQKLAGTNKELSDSIAILWYLGEKGLMRKEDIEFILGLLDVLRLSDFATSEKTNEISKMGFMLPKSTREVDFSDDTE